ncbi:uncharacterized protein LOC133515927 isoform X1 [Cydia pomonella]|uniref:uncharacterized protein LOC133515927 isoform X1 n=1 Tax=Cydia pomonella TaxID=82600 RepID=UPI002ADE8DDA|nr:uncharacterized protein LOC133515927 isoform X1 [Cydia pomonella]
MTKPRGFIKSAPSFTRPSVSSPPSAPSVFMSTMREAFVSILLLVATANCSDLGKDVNYYKDYLRARSDELPEGPAMADRLYFYRTPLQLYPGLLPVLEQEYRKRTGNVFKNHMLNKDSLLEGLIPEKRSSKTALSAMLQGKHALPTIEYDQGEDHDQDNMDFIVE